MKFETDFFSSYEEAAKIALFIEKFLKEECNIKNEKHLFLLSIAIRELLNNAVSHGNCFDFQKKVKLKILFENNILIVQITDEGKGFELKKDCTEFKEPLRERCRGIWLIHEFGFEIEVQKNTVTAKINLLNVKEKEEK